MLEHRWEKLSKKACEHADESMFPVGGFPVLCPAQLSTASPACSLPADSSTPPRLHCSLTEIPWPQHQMQVPGCAGGCCFRFLSAPNFSLYSIGRCWEMSTRALATARPWENPQREHMLRSSLLLFSKINFKNLFTFPQCSKQSNSVCREVLLALCSFLHLSPRQLRNCFHSFAYILSGFSYTNTYPLPLPSYTKRYSLLFRSIKPSALLGGGSI